tara:strand:- start:174 stop:875 length:702 start_codon:yes stop_codon:yes gene_type:complete
MSAFDEIVIKRFNNNRQSQKFIDVRYVYAPKQRVVHDLINKSQHIQLPVVVASITGIERDEKRVFNKIDGFVFPKNYTITSTGAEYDQLPPVNPVNISVKMSILTKYQADMDQILTNFVPYANPYIILSWKIPQGTKANDPFIEADSPIQELRSEVLWDGSISMEYPTEVSGKEAYRISADTNFTIKGWLFAKPPSDLPGTIFDVSTNFVAVSSIDDLDGGQLPTYNPNNDST